MIEATGNSPKARKWSVLAAAALLLAGCNVSPEQDAAAIERDILATPGAQDLWQTIKDEYPEDFAVLVARIQELDPAERRDPVRTEEVGGTFLIEFIDRIAPQAVKAPAPEMIAWSKAESDLYSTLQRGAVSQCAALTMGQPIAVEPSNAAAVSAIARRTVAIVRAAAAAQRDPQDYAVPDATDWDRLGDTIAQTGLPPELQETLGSESALMALTEAQRCEVGTALYTGISNLPDDVEPHMAAFMLSVE